jgi:hypothetical protein
MDEIIAEINNYVAGISVPRDNLKGRTYAEK